MFTDVKVGYTCNNRCIHCVIEPARQDLEESRRPLDRSTEALLGFLDDARRRGSDSVVLTGGEVTLRKDFPELLAHVRDLGLELAVQTNGRRLEHWDRAGILDGLKGVFTVAIHGPDAATHDAITRRHGSFDETMRGLDALERHPGIAVTGKLVISRRNQELLETTLERMADRGIRRFNVAFPHAERFPPDVFASVVPRYRDLRPELENCARFLASSGCFGEFETVPFCTSRDCAEFWTRSADPGLIKGAMNNPGFIRAPGDDELHEWESLRLSSKYKAERCRQCLFDKACEGPWREYVEVFGDEELQPLDSPDIMERIG